MSSCSIPLPWPPSNSTTCQHQLFDGQPSKSCKRNLLRSFARNRLPSSDSHAMQHGKRNDMQASRSVLNPDEFVSDEEDEDEAPPRIPLANPFAIGQVPSQSEHAPPNWRSAALSSAVMGHTVGRPI